MSTNTDTGSVADSLNEDNYQRWFNYCVFIRGRDPEELNHIANATESGSHDDWLDAWQLLGSWLDWLFGAETTDADGGESE
ncbi:hypothetical protein [Rhodopirellula bahusiensis]|uniref:hypothetical protein n=1 Tax=Rhodopirellula bahusiensis TaxID=2014065 RepID=UPI0032674A76